MNIVGNTAGENMDIDSPATAIGTNVVDSVQKSPEKADVRQDVGPDVETSLGQHDNYGVMLLQVTYIKRDVLLTIDNNVILTHFQQSNSRRFSL